jgi:hypothetical protein
MSTSLWTRFRKTQSDEDSLDHDIGEKKPVQEITPAVDVGPGGLSFEEGAAVNSFQALVLGSMGLKTLLEVLAVISASPHVPFSSLDASSVLVSFQRPPRF